MNETNDILLPIEDPEIVIGLVGPIGVDIPRIKSMIAQQLAIIGYSVSHLRVTDALREFRLPTELVDQPLEKRFHSFMDAGNEARDQFGLADLFSFLAVTLIRAARRAITNDSDTPAKRHAYVVSQFKRPEEIHLLRKIYGSHFIVISIHSPRDARVDYLSEEIAKSYHDAANPHSYRGLAEQLINRDNEEEEKPFGQRLRDTFHLGDFIVSLRNDIDLTKSFERFIKAFFGYPFITPNRDEYFSYAARSAALRSSDLSRQVGAVIVSASDEIISVGCNEVPKAGGGTYWTGEQHDYRDFQLGFDSNVRFRDQIVADIIKRLKSGWLSSEYTAMTLEELVNAALYDPKNAILKEALVSDLLEFGRVVHAEMLAISDAARRGLSTLGATLYCTTFPCHICTRHIIAAGIRRVVYLEPYAKSRAQTLYKDSVIVDGHRYQASASVNFSPLEGITPSRYRDIFSKGKRKNSLGNANDWKNPPQPIIQSFLSTYILLEQRIVKGMDRGLQRMTLRSSAKPF
jgi:cytidine deaminase